MSVNGQEVPRAPRPAPGSFPPDSMLFAKCVVANRLGDGYARRVNRPDFFVFENSSKGMILALPFEAHTIQVIVTKKGFLNYFKLREVDPIDFAAWARRNVRPLSQIAWYAYDQGRYRERMVATNLVRQLEIDIDKFSGWAFA